MIDAFSRAIANNTVTGKNSLKPTLAETLRILRAVHTLPPRRSQVVTMAVPSTMEPTNVLALSCSTSSLRMTRGLLMMVSHRRDGGTELPPPPRRYALSKPGYLPSSIYHTPRGLHQGERDYRGSRMAGLAYCRRAIDTVGAGERSRLGEDAVASYGEA
jgi:hypothetical protein